MGDQLANNPEALRLFFNEDIYLLAEPEMPMADSPVTSPISEAEITSQTDMVVKHVVIPIQMPVAPSISALQEDPSPGYEKGSDNPATAGVGSSTVAGDEPEISFNFKGKNARNILVLVYDEVNEVTTAEGRELFKNIVKAKELSGSDYAIVNYADYKGSSFAQLKRFFEAKAILTFGVQASQLGLAEYPTHTVIQHEGVQMLFSIDLHQISLDTSIKRALWAALQQMEL